MTAGRSFCVVLSLRRFRLEICWSSIPWRVVAAELRGDFGGAVLLNLRGPPLSF